MNVKKMKIFVEKENVIITMVLIIVFVELVTKEIPLHQNVSVNKILELKSNKLISTNPTVKRKICFLNLIKFSNKESLEF